MAGLHRAGRSRAAHLGAAGFQVVHAAQGAEQVDLGKGLDDEGARTGEHDLLRFSRLRAGDDGDNGDFGELGCHLIHNVQSGLAAQDVI